MSLTPCRPPRSRATSSATESDSAPAPSFSVALERLLVAALGARASAAAQGAPRDAPRGDHAFIRLAAGCAWLVLCLAVAGPLLAAAQHSYLHCALHHSWGANGESLWADSLGPCEPYGPCSARPHFASEIAETAGGQPAAAEVAVSFAEGDAASPIARGCVGCAELAWLA